MKEKIFCTNCGEQLTNEDKYCSECGTEIIKVEQPKKRGRKKKTEEETPVIKEVIKDITILPLLNMLLYIDQVQRLK